MSKSDVMTSDGIAESKEVMLTNREGLPQYSVIELNVLLGYGPVLFGLVQDYLSKSLLHRSMPVGIQPVKYQQQLEITGELLVDLTAFYDYTSALKALQNCLVTLEESKAFDGFRETAKVITGSRFTTDIFHKMLGSLINNVSHLIVSWDIWDDILSSSDFGDHFYSSTRQEMLEGNLGSYRGVEIWTDGFRYQEHTTLKNGEAIMFGKNPGEILLRDLKILPGKKMNTRLILDELLCGEPNKIVRYMR